MDTSDSINESSTEIPASDERYAGLEQLGTKFDAVRMWFTKAGRIGVLMAKGGYLLSERKRLFEKLGEEIFYKVQKGEFAHPEIEPLVSEIERLTKKLEIEELLIRGIRFGKAEKRRYAQEGEQEPTILNEV